MEMKPDTELSRRTFLGSTAAVAGGALAATPTATAATNPSLEKEINPSDDTSQFDQYGEISREGYRLLAEVEYRAARKKLIPSFSKKVDAVADLGLDPTGGEPVQNKIASAAEPGMLIVCPKGSEFHITGNMNVSVDGPFGIVGKGWKTSKQPPKPDSKDAVTFNVDNNGPTVIGFSTPAGLFANFLIDQRGPKQTAGTKLRTDGSILLRDVRTVGPQSSKYPQEQKNSAPALASVTGDNGVVRAHRYVNIGGGKSGSKESSGHPIVWAGMSHHGVAQFIDCHIENSADNGAYASRAPGDVEIYRGLWRNNDVSQVRLSGKGSRIDGTEIVVDGENYSGLGTKKGWPAVNGIKWDGKPTRNPTPGGKIVNCDVRGETAAGQVGGLIHVFDTAGAATIENTRVVCKIDAIPIVAQAPTGGTHYPPPPQPHRVIVKHSVITGGKASGGAIKIQGRPNSLVDSVCLKYPSASPDDISGQVKTTNIGYGRNCGPNQGLSAPKKVGGNPGSGLPPVNVTYSGTLSNTKKKRKKKTKKMSIFATGVLVVLVIIAAVVILPFLIAGFSIFVTLLVAYISTDDD